MSEVRISELNNVENMSSLSDLIINTTEGTKKISAKNFIDSMLITDKTSVEVTVNANAFTDMKWLACGKEDYKVIGVVGHSLRGTNSKYCSVKQINPTDDGNSVVYDIANMHTSSVTVTLEVTVLYRKAV